MRVRNAAPLDVRSWFVAFGAAAVVGFAPLVAISQNPFLPAACVALGAEVAILIGLTACWIRDVKHPKDAILSMDVDPSKPLRISILRQLGGGTLAVVLSSVFIALGVSARDVPAGFLAAIVCTVLAWFLGIAGAGSSWRVSRRIFLAQLGLTVLSLSPLTGFYAWILMHPFVLVD